MPVTLVHKEKVLAGGQGSEVEFNGIIDLILAQDHLAVHGVFGYDTGLRPMPTLTIISGIRVITYTDI